MTQFSQIELIYNQYLNLANEIADLIADEEYDATSAKLEHHDKLIKQLALAKITVKLTETEKLTMQAMETTIQEKTETILANLKKLRVELASEVKTTKEKVKLSSAYDAHADGRQGDLIDISE